MYSIVELQLSDRGGGAALEPAHGQSSDRNIGDSRQLECCTAANQDNPKKALMWLSSGHIQSRD
jgi:hypothetical protein